MSVWLITAAVLLVSLVPVGWVCLRAGPMDRVVALQLASTIDALILVVLSEALGRDALFDVALLAALLSFAGGLTFVRFMERWV
jgi:multisubunit Na+/H+ antiporter MnhF subunit